MIVVLAGLLMTLPLESPQALHLRKARRAEKESGQGGAAVVLYSALDLRVLTREQE